MKDSGCYNCPVKGCTAAYRGSQCAHLRELAGVDFDPKTNGDCIRDMSDEKLAKWMAEQTEKEPSDDSDVWLNWLRRPAEED